MEPIVRLSNRLPGLLSGTELSVYALLAALGGKKGIVLTSGKRLAAALSLSPGTVFRALYGLRRKGFLQRVEGRKPDDPSEYRISPPPKKDFFCIPGSAVCRFAGNALLVLAYLHRRADRLGLAYPSLRDIASGTGLDRKTVRRQILRLRTGGFLDLVPRNYKRTAAHRSYIYQLWVGGGKKDTLVRLPTRERESFLNKKEREKENILYSVFPSAFENPKGRIRYRRSGGAGVEQDGTKRGVPRQRNWKGAGRDPPEL